MSYALVGTIGAASQGVAGAAVTPAFGTGETRAAGNLLVCFVAVNGSANVPATPSGWSAAVSFGASAASAALFYKVAAGGDAAPTLAAVTSGVITGQLAEFSGNDTVTVIDHQAVPGGTASPAVAAVIATASNELICYAYAITYSAAATKTFTDTLNNGQVAHVTNNAAVSTASHYHFNWSIPTSNAANPQDSLAITTTKITEWDAIVASFLLPAPSVTTPPKPTVVMQAVKRASVW